MTKEKEKSDCCNEDVETICADEGTCYWACLGCGMPCNIKTIKND